MGTNIKDLLLKKEVDFKHFDGKVLAVDSFNILYQFITTIRQRDGSLLKDSNGNVTSHLTGLFSRTTRLMRYGIKPVFVFDGESPELKKKERERRKTLKIEAEKRFQEAKKKKDLDEMKKYASRASRLTAEMINESKELISALGLPFVQATSEGEAQVAYIVSQGDAYAGVSEDYDSLLYGIPRLVKNLTISGRKKSGASYKTIKPNMISFTENMNHLGIDRDKLIMIAMLVGTDYNAGGVKGIGPKNALKLVKEYGEDPEKLFKKVEWRKHCETDWNEIFYLFKKMPINKDYKISFSEVDVDKITEILVEKHNFSSQRVENSLKELLKNSAAKQQKGLGEWI